MKVLDKLVWVTVVCLVVSIMGVYALTSWTHRIPWDIPPPKTYAFQVYDMVGNPIETDLSSTTFTSSPYSESYNIMNIGTGDITISLSEVLTSGSKSWNVTFPLPLPAGASVIATITLTVDGTGSYQFTFAKSP
jgi:hypothetical protein